MKIKLIGMMLKNLIKMQNKLINKMDNKEIKTKKIVKKFKFKMMAHN